MTDVLVGDSEYDLSTQRRHIDALARKGIDGLVLSGLGRDKPGADDAVREWWQHNQPVDRVICTNANVCLSLLRLFNGLDLPPDWLPLVVSFDASPWMQHLRYPVAALRQPVGRIGATAAAAILARIKGVTANEAQFRRVTGLDVVAYR